MTHRFHARHGAFLLAAALALPALAKLPVPPQTPEAKAKADETAARTAWATRIEMYQLCRSMDRVAATYRQQAHAAGKDVKPPVETPSCTDPGAFAYTAPSSAPPLEVSGAHSPAATAIAPPSTNQTATQIQGPSKK